MRLRQSSAADSKLRPDGGEGRRKEGEKEVERKEGRGGCEKGMQWWGGEDTRNKVGHPEFHSSVIQWANWINPPPRLFSLV